MPVTTVSLEGSLAGVDRVSRISVRHLGVHEHELAPEALFPDAWAHDAGRGFLGTVVIDSTRPPRWSEGRLLGAVP